MCLGGFLWPLLVAGPSFVTSELQPIQTRFLKKWVGLAERADPRPVNPVSRSGAGSLRARLEGGEGGAQERTTHSATSVSHLKGSQGEGDP